MTRATKILVAILGIVLVVWGIYYYAQNRTPRIEDGIQDAILEEEETAVRAQVEELGRRLKNVSLLAPASQLREAMQREYGAYVAPDLLARWQENPSQALGRTVSSPWPDSLDISSVEKQADGSYVVMGEVVEVSSAQNGTSPTGIYEVMLRVEETNGRWLVTEAQRGVYSQMPTQVTKRGRWECLPPKDTSGPQTLECAFGLLEDGTNLHYALDLSPLSRTGVNYPNNTRVEVRGIVSDINDPASALAKYNIEGVIYVSYIREI